MKKTSTRVKPDIGIWGPVNEVDDHNSDYLTIKTRPASRGLLGYTTSDMVYVNLGGTTAVFSLKKFRKLLKSLEKVTNED